MEDNKRETLIKIGQRLFSQYGYREVSIQAVARVAGISAGSFYNYFASKEAFYQEILDRIESQGIRRLEKSVEKFKSPINRLRALYRFVTLGIRNNPMLRGALAGDERYIFPGTEARKERGSDIRARVKEMIMNIIRDGTIKNIFRSGMFRNTSEMIEALYDAILLRIDSDKIDDLVEDFLLLIERGLKRRIQLRKREERVDRRMLRREDSDDL